MIYVTILILVDGFLQCVIVDGVSNILRVTILILVDGFLQLEDCKIGRYHEKTSQSLF